MTQQAVWVCHEMQWRCYLRPGWDGQRRCWSRSVSPGMSCLCSGTTTEWGKIKSISINDASFDDIQMINTSSYKLTFSNCVCKISHPDTKYYNRTGEKFNQLYFYEWCMFWLSIFDNFFFHEIKISIQVRTCLILKEWVLFLWIRWLFMRRVEIWDEVCVLLTQGCLFVYFWDKCSYLGGCQLTLCLFIFR